MQSIDKSVYPKYNVNVTEPIFPNRDSILEYYLFIHLDLNLH